MFFPSCPRFERAVLSLSVSSVMSRMKRHALRFLVSLKVSVLFGTKLPFTSCTEDEVGGSVVTGRIFSENPNAHSVP
jgi:hypothetical protein